MTGFDEDRAAMAAAHDQAQQAFGPLQQAHDAIEQARAMLLRVTETSSQAAAHDALALLSRAMEEVVGVQQTVSAAVQTSEGVASGL
jgi:hypothetical protein